MNRLLRIFVLLLAVMPLAMPVAQWPSSSQCKAHMETGHLCCPEHAKVTAPSCCNAKADSTLAEGRNTAEEVRLIAGSPAFPSVPFVESRKARPVREPHAAYIPILLPTLILRT